MCKCLAAALKTIPDTEAFTSRERLQALSSVNQLSSHIGACERLLQTPVPLNCTRMTAREPSAAWRAPPHPHSPLSVSLTVRPRCPISLREMRI